MAIIDVYSTDVWDKEFVEAAKGRPEVTDVLSFDDADSPGSVLLAKLRPDFAKDFYNNREAAFSIVDQQLQIRATMLDVGRNPFDGAAGDIESKKAAIAALQGELRKIAAKYPNEVTT